MVGEALNLPRVASFSVAISERAEKTIVGQLPRRLRDYGIRLLEAVGARGAVQHEERDVELSSAYDEVGLEAAPSRTYPLGGGGQDEGGPASC